jgi:hypothetical protein
LKLKIKFLKSFMFFISKKWNHKSIRCTQFLQFLKNFIKILWVLIFLNFDDMWVIIFSSKIYRIIPRWVILIWKILFSKKRNWCKKEKNFKWQHFILTNYSHSLFNIWLVKNWLVKFPNFMDSSLSYINISY